MLKGSSLDHSFSLTCVIYIPIPETTLYKLFLGWFYNLIECDAYLLVHHIQLDYEN